MAEKEFNTRIVHKHDTQANWEKAVGFIPKQGELIVYDVDENYDYQRIKIGDGVKNVNALPFYNDGFVTSVNGMTGDVTIETEQIIQNKQDIEELQEQAENFATDSDLDAVRSAIRYKMHTDYARKDYVDKAISEIEIPEGGSSIVVSDSEPEDTSVLWIDPNDNETDGGSGSGVVVSDSEPEDTSVLWVDTDDDETDDLQEAINEALAQAKASGEFKGEKGDPGKTPEKGKDYFTQAEVQAIAELAAEMVDVPEDGGSNQPLTFTGAVNATYDGSEAVTVNIPSGGGNGGGGVFSLPLLYETTTTEEVRWIDTGDNAFEAKNIIIVDLLSKATATNESEYSVCCSVYNDILKPNAPFSNYGLGREIQKVLVKQYDRCVRIIGFRGNDGNWSALLGCRPITNTSAVVPNLHIAEGDTGKHAIKGVIIGDHSGQAGTRVFGVGTTLKIWGC